VNATCQGNLSVCHFGHASHRFFSPILEVLVSFSIWIENFESNEANMSGVSWLVACMGGIQETWPIRATQRARSFPLNYITPKLKYGGSILLRNAGFKLQLTKPPGIKYQKTTVKFMKNFRCKKTHSARKHNRRNHDTPAHRPLNQYYMIYHQTDLYFHVTQTDPEAPRWWQPTAETCRSRYIEQSSTDCWSFLLQHKFILLTKESRWYSVTCTVNCLWPIVYFSAETEDFFSKPSRAVLGFSPKPSTAVVDFFSKTVYSSSRANPASLSTTTPVKSGRNIRRPHTSTQRQGWKWVELYLYSTNTPSWCWQEHAYLYLDRKWGEQMPARSDVF
jgi:hypothetical protein